MRRPKKAGKAERPSDSASRAKKQ
ncbi:hypothetical protein E2320_003823, partial [Naja naja]